MPSGRSAPPDFIATRSRGLTWGRPASLLAIAASTLLMFAALTAFYLYFFFEFPQNSDGASTLLTAADMLDGNWRLSGWWLSGDNFWTSDTFLELLLIKTIGFTPAIMFIAPALLWAGVVTAAVALTVTGRTQPAGGLLLVAVVLGLPMLRWNWPMSLIADAGEHVGSLLYALAMFVLAARACEGPWSPRTIVACGVVTALALPGDDIILWVGVAPILAVTGLAAFTRRDPRQAWLPVAVIAGALFAKLAVHWNEASGGFHTHAMPIHFVPFMSLGSNIAKVMNSFLALTGSDFFDRALQPAAPFIARSPLLLLIVAAVALAGIRYVRLVRAEATPDLATPGDALPMLERFLLMGVVINILAAMFSNLLRDVSTARYFLPGLVFAVILAARTLPPKRWIIALCSVALAATVLVNGHAYLRNPPRPTIAEPRLVELADRLLAEGLTDGYSSYWSGALVTVLTDGRVRARVVDVDPSGKLVPNHWFSSDAWYADFGQHRPFFVIEDKLPIAGQMTEAPIVATFGEPSRRIELRDSVIAVFDPPG